MEVQPRWLQHVVLSVYGSGPELCWCILELWLIKACKCQLHRPSHRPTRMQVLEHSLSSVCNLAAGNQQAKQALCEAGAIEPLLGILVSCVDRSLAQLAALALRNLSRNSACRDEIVRLDGVAALLDFLSEGLSDLYYSLDCHVRISTCHRECACKCLVNIAAHAVNASQHGCGSGRPCICLTLCVAMRDLHSIYTDTTASICLAEQSRHYFIKSLHAGCRHNTKPKVASAHVNAQWQLM